MNLLKILTVASAAAWLYTSTANAQENVNQFDRDLSVLVSDSQQLVQDLQRDMEEMAAGEGRQRGSRDSRDSRDSTMNSLSLPRTAENTAKDLARERKEVYVDTMCQAISLDSNPVVDENGRRLPMDATYLHPDGTVILIGVATLEGMDEQIAQNCPRIVGKGYDAFHSSLSERVLSSVANLHDSLGTQAPPFIAYAAKGLSDAIQKAYAALPSEMFTDRDRELVQSNYFKGIEQRFLEIQGKELPEKFNAYAEMYQQGVQEGSVILQNLGLLGLEGNSYALTVPTVEFSAGRFRESEKLLQQEGEGHFDGVRFVEEVLIPYVQQVYVDSMTQQQEHGTRR